MLLEDFDKLIVDGQISTDGLIKVRDSFIETNTTIESLNKKIGDLENRNKELLDTNAKLYLRVTGQPSSDMQVENTPSIDDIIKNWEVK